MDQEKSRTSLAPIPSPRLSRSNQTSGKQEYNNISTDGLVASGVASLASIPTAIASKGIHFLPHIFIHKSNLQFSKILSDFPHSSKFSSLPLYLSPGPSLPIPLPQ